MFWGLIMEPGRCYSQTVKVPFHVSMAALDVANATEQPAQVMCVFEGRNYLLCTLNNKEQIQCPLDLNFEAGTKLSFATNGKSHVHLTGYLTGYEGEDDVDEEEVEEEEKQLSKKQKKRLKQAIAEQPPKKKAKTDLTALVQDAEEEEESSDSDFDINMLGQVESDSDDIEEEEVNTDDLSGEEAEDEEHSAEEEEENDSSMSDEEEVPAQKPKQNGIAKKADATPQSLKKKEKQLQDHEKTPKDKKKNKEDKQQQQQTPKGKKQTLKGGVIAEDLKVGTGTPVKPGKMIRVYYEGRLKDNNKLFDSTNKGPGFAFRVGKSEVIRGWDIGVLGMQVGGKRRLICPPNTAYGMKGSPPAIPPNATLVFDVEVLHVGNN